MESSCHRQDPTDAHYLANQIAVGSAAAEYTAHLKAEKDAGRLPKDVKPKKPKGGKKGARVAPDQSAPAPRRRRSVSDKGSDAVGMCVRKERFA